MDKLQNNAPVTFGTICFPSMAEESYVLTVTWRTKLLNLPRRFFQWHPLEEFLQRKVQGHSNRSGWAKLVPPEYLYRPGSLRSVTRNGRRLHLDLSNMVDHWAFFGMADPAHRAFEERIRPGSTVVDVGANIGLQSLTYAGLVGNAGRVISLEPHPRTFKRLHEHITLNGTTNISAVNVGIGQEEAVVDMYEVVATNAGMNRIIRDMEDPDRYPRLEVKIRPLPQVLADLGVHHVDAMKIDVEGFELEVLRGCRSILASDKPALLIELDDDNLLQNGASASAVVDYLGELGYSVRKAADGTVLPRQLEHQHFDILCW